MPANAVVRARIDQRVKEEAAAILAAAGLTISDAFRMMLMRTVTEKALPFDPLVPNAETIEAMKAARRGDLVTVGGVDDLLADLHADDQAHRPLQTRLQTRGKRPASSDARSGSAGGHLAPGSRHRYTREVSRPRPDR